MIATRIMDKQVLIDTIYHTVKNSGQSLTRKEICTLIGYKKDPHVLEIIETLTEHGWFIKVQSETRNGLPVFKYFVNEIKAKELEALG